MCPDDLFLDGFAPRDVDDQARDESAQIEPAPTADRTHGAQPMGSAGTDIRQTNAQP